MKTWYMGNDVNVELGQKVTVLKTGSGWTTFGEPAMLTDVSAKYLVFTTESGVKVKTSRDNIHNVSGKAKAAGYSVALKAFESFKDMIHMPVNF